MAGLTNTYGRGQQELSQEAARHEEESERRNRQEQEAYKHNLEAANRIIEIFHRNKSVFRKSDIAYCLDRENPPFAPTICLFRRNKPRKPEMIFIPVDVNGPYGTFSLRSLTKRKKREATKWTTNHTKCYEEHHTRLSNDPEEAAIEIVKRLTSRTMQFDSLWEFDRTMGVCARRYFARRRAALGLGFVAIIAVAATFLFWIAQHGW